MTKTIALVLASLTLAACAVDADERSDAPVASASGETRPAPTASSAEEPCPSEPTSTGPKKTPGLIEKCAGDYECNGGRGYGGSGKEASLHSDGIACRVAENPGDDLTLEPGGRVLLDGKQVGTWSGDSVAFTYTHDYANGPVEYRCRPLPASAR